MFFLWGWISLCRHQVKHERQSRNSMNWLLFQSPFCLLCSLCSLWKPLNLTIFQLFRILAEPFCEKWQRYQKMYPHGQTEQWKQEQCHHWPDLKVQMSPKVMDLLHHAVASLCKTQFSTTSIILHTVNTNTGICYSIQLQQCCAMILKPWLNRLRQ